MNIKVMQANFMEQDDFEESAFAKAELSTTTLP